MIKVLARDTGEKIPKEEAYKASNGKYYSSESAYKQIVSETNFRSKCLSEIGILLNKDEGILAPVVNKKLMDFKDIGFEVVYETIKRYWDKFEWAKNNKEFNSDMQAASYMFAIVKNYCGVVQKELKKEKRTVATFDNIPQDLTISNPVHKNKDIRSFLND